MEQAASRKRGRGPPKLCSVSVGIYRVIFKQASKQTTNQPTNQPNKQTNKQLGDY
jgi:hypothetical protein